MCQLTGLVREQDFAGLLKRGRILLAVEQMVQHSVEDLLGIRLRQVQHQLCLAQEVLDVEVCSYFSRKVFHRDFLRQICAGADGASRPLNSLQTYSVRHYILPVYSLPRLMNVNVTWYEIRST